MPSRYRVVALLLALAVLSVVPARAQTDGGTATAQPDLPRVEKVSVGDAGAATSAQTASAGIAEIGDQITVEVEHFDAWCNGGYVDAKHPSIAPGRRDPRKLTLSLSGFLLKDIVPLAVTIGNDPATTGYILFRLDRTSANKGVWTSLLTRDTDTVEVSIALPNDDPLPVKTGVSASFHFVPCKNPIVAWSTVVVFVAVLVLFGWLSTKFPLLRDSDCDATGVNRPYSLGRCQMALWFFTVFGSFITLWVIFKAAPELPNAVLTLIGISAATAFGGAVVDASKRSSALADLKQLQTQAAARQDRVQAIDTQLAPLTPMITTANAANAPVNPTALTQHQSLTKDRADLTAQSNDAAAKMVELAKTKIGARTEGFFGDILDDSDGPSFHRFQIVAWTLLLWVFFLWSMVHTLSMPVFSDQLLGLMGISAGTYIGFKFPEQKA